MALQVTPVLHTTFGKPGRDDDSRAGASTVTLLQGVEHLVVGHNNAYQIRRFRESCDAGIGFRTHNLVIPWVHGVDAYPVLRFERCSQEAAAVLQTRGRANHGQRAWVKHLMYRCHLVVGPDLHAESLSFHPVLELVELCRIPPQHFGALVLGHTLETPGDIVARLGPRRRGLGEIGFPHDVVDPEILAGFNS